MQGSILQQSLASRKAMKVDDNLNLLRTVMAKKGETVISVLSAFHLFGHECILVKCSDLGTECQYFDVTYVKQKDINYKWNIFCAHIKNFLVRKKFSHFVQKCTTHHKVQRQIKIDA